MRIIAYRTTRKAFAIRPATTRRQWMDETTNKFAYRCLPLTMANGHGWELLSQCSFEALWTGGHSLQSMAVVRLGGEGELPWSHFGEGVLTFSPGYLFRTDEPFNLYVSGPPNIRKDGIVPLTGIVETNWNPFTFTMNWLFTRPGVPVRFEEGEPVCQVFPVPKTLVEEVEPEIRDISSEPDVQAHFAEWERLRVAFNRDLKTRGSEADRLGWQRFYNRGTLPDGQFVARGHVTRFNVKPFVQVGHREPSDADKKEEPENTAPVGGATE